MPSSLATTFARCARDSVFCANTLFPMKPHDGQIKWLRNSVQPINVLVPGNRFGKSTVIAMKHIHKNLFKVGLPPMSQDQWMREPYETMSASFAADQAEIVFKKATQLLSDPVLKPFVSSIRSTPFPHIRFYNGAIMHCRSAHDGGKYLDGHGYRYLSIDEAGWIDELKKLMNGVIIMRLAGGGEIDLIGTPKGYNDLYFYYARGERGVDGYYSQRGSIYDNPYLSEEDLRVRDKLLAGGDAKLRKQVLEGEFVDFEGLAFGRDQLEQATDRSLPLKQPWQEGHSYVCGWDLGRVSDYTVGCVLDVTTRPWVLVDFIRLNRVPWEEIYRQIEETRVEYHCNFATIDATGPSGDVIEEELVKRGTPVWGVRMSGRTAKVDLINGLQNAFDEGRQAIGTYDSVDELGQVSPHPLMEEPGGDWGALRFPLHVQLLDELGVYRFDDKKLVQDSVIALALAVQGAYDRESVREPVIGGLFGSGGIGG